LTFSFCLATRDLIFPFGAAETEMETIVVVAHLSKEMATSVNTLAATVTLAMKLLTVQ